MIQKLNIKLFLILFFFAFVFKSKGQGVDMLKEFTNLGVTEIDSSLTSLFNEMKTASFQLRSDSLAPLFKDQLLGYLAHPVTFRNELDSLSRYLTVWNVSINWRQS